MGMVDGSGAHNRQVLERMREIIQAGEWDRLGEVVTTDFVQEMPQSGERVVGLENLKKVMQHFTTPQGGLQMGGNLYIAGDEEHYVVTPTFNVVRVADSGDQLTSYVQTTYPDGSKWFIVTFTTFRDGKIAKRVDFFAPFYDAPEWRAPYVQKM